MEIIAKEFTLHLTSDRCSLLPGSARTHGLVADAVHEFVTGRQVVTIWAVGCEWTAAQVRACLEHLGFSNT